MRQFWYSVRFVCSPNGSGQKWLRLWQESQWKSSLIKFQNPVVFAPSNGQSRQPGKFEIERIESGTVQPADPDRLAFGQLLG